MTVNRAVKGNLPLITYANRRIILDNYFPKSAINLSPYMLIVWSYAPKALIALPSASPSVISIEVAGNLDLN